MAIDYKSTAEQLVKQLGGDSNIQKVSHCATRLRFILKDESAVNDEAVTRIPGVITALRAGGQYQVVIGNHVTDAYKFVDELITPKADAPRLENKKAGVFTRIVDVISSIFAPFLYTLAACGILQGILGVLDALNLIDTAGGTYKILNFVSWTAFTFLPVLIAVTASKKFGLNTFIGVVIACALVSPDYIAMVNAGEAVSFLGIPVQLLSYTSTVIPIILAMWVASYIEKFFNKILPLVIRSLFSALLTIAIMVPLTLLAFGPVGNAIGGAIGDVYNYLYSLSPIVAGIIVGGLWEVLVIFGVHWGITPVTVGNYANLGYDTFTGLQASAVFSQAGATLGVCLKSKNKETKRVAASAAVTGIFGITEPAIYGVTLRYKKPMVCACVAGAVGGAIAGAFNAVSWAYNMPGIATLPAYYKQGHMTQFIGLLISITVSFVLGAVLTYIVGFKDDPIKESESAANDDNTQTKESVVIDTVINAPVSGKAKPITEVKDPAFSSEALGKGIGIEPTQNAVFAPFDCTVETLPDTCHAVGLSNSDGISVLIHIGIDTVKLNGKYFKSLVKVGDTINAGDPIIEFNREEIRKQGYDTTVMFVVTELPENGEVYCKSEGELHKGEAAITVSAKENKDEQTSG